MPGVSLSQLVTTVADELRLASANRKVGKEVMTFSECELEFSATIEKGGTAGIIFNIVSLSGSKKDSSSHTIKLKFTASPNSIQAHARPNKGGSRPPVKKVKKVA